MKIATTVDRLVILVVLTAIFILFIWCGWRLSRPMSTASNPIKKVFGLLSAMFLGGLIWVAWKFQPWMPAGRAVHLSSVQIGDYDFQVWQRKNASITEPFTTGLFGRKHGGQWKAFLLDFEDVYRPAITLRKEESGIAVLDGSNVLGYFDEERQDFIKHHHDGDLTPIQADTIDSDPPGNWWLQNSSTP